MKIRIVLAIFAVGTFVGQTLGEGFTSTWWNGVVYRKGRFESATPYTDRPKLVSRSNWKSEDTPKGTIIRVGELYVTVDEKGVVCLSSQEDPECYWVMKEVKKEDHKYNAKDDWTGTWSRTTYTLEPTAPGLRGGKLGFRDGKLTVHPKNKGIAILSVTDIDARVISGK